MSEYCDRRGAEKIAQMIRDYWAMHGADVQVGVVHAGFVPVMRGSRYDVRSDLINGLPVKCEGKK